MKSFFSLLATITALLLSLTSAQEEAADAGKYDCRPVQERCPTATALIAADYLVEDWRLALDENNLIRIQATKAAGATIRIVLRNGEDNTCTNSGEVDLLEGLIPILNGTTIAAPYNIETKYVDNKGRLLVFTTAAETIDAVDYNIKSRFVFVPIPGTCDFRLSEFSIFDQSC